MLTVKDNLPKNYEPSELEAKWNAFWQENNLFKTDLEAGKPSFSIVIPPPNVTGSLHIGHALNNTIQDIIIRRKRMQGYNALWLPGTDHGGIATQNVVEKNLAKQGLSRHDLGREKFVEKVWEWKEQYGNKIIGQLKRLGCSPDWTRERFTMDEGCSKAVRKAFVELYEKGLIYRGHRIINWCSRCQTALSDIEVEHLDTEGKLYHFRYPLADGDGYLVIATTRPETMFGDTAVAVHPDDERYQHLIGKEVKLPLTDRTIPIIADEYVEREFGTGVVKITPAHDPNDFLVGERHNLPQINVMNNDATMKDVGIYSGLDRYECRKKILVDLEAQGLLEKIEDHNHAVGHCSRCDTVVEPLVSEQWFVKMQPLSVPAMQVVKDNILRFLPEKFSKTYMDWLENIKDWCISRQIWWGHRIPVWYCQDCGEVIAAIDDPTECPKCHSHKLEQDQDVLDTWFSSALWPFSTFGWPEKTPELDKFYPTSVLVTGYDIIYFWVARMIFMGLEFMGEKPFSEVLINGIVRDKDGKKMSKSRGNTVDPLEIIDQFGADTLRFALISASVPGNDMRLHQERFESTRYFCNKIWNAARFVLMNLEDYDPEKPAATDYSLADRWIISRFQQTLAELDKLMDRYDFGAASKLVYEFIWNEICDWYIELVKPDLYQKERPEVRQRVQGVLVDILSQTMALLHPFMPYLSEEIWQALPHKGISLMLAEWPKQCADKIDLQAEKEMALIMDLIKAVRNIRSEVNIVPSKKVEVIMQATLEDIALMESGKVYFQTLGGLSSLEITLLRDEKPDKAMTARVGSIELYLPLAGLLDLDKERARLQKELEKAEKEIARVDNKLANQGFVAKAPANVIEKEKEKREEWLVKKAKIAERLAAL
ncbi:MAG: valine--tRNA ligase [bacterium]